MNDVRVSVNQSDIGRSILQEILQVIIYAMLTSYALLLLIHLECNIYWIHVICSIHVLTINYRSMHDIYFLCVLKQIELKLIH